MRRIRKSRSFQPGMVPLGAVVAVLLQMSVACAQSCTPSVTSCCEIDNDPCYGTENAACNGIIKSLSYTAMFPDGTSQTNTLMGTGGAGSAGTCNSGVMIPQASTEYWPTFYSPQTGNGYAILSEADQSTNCVVSYCGRLGIPYCGVFSNSQAAPQRTYVSDTCSQCT